MSAHATFPLLLAAGGRRLWTPAMLASTVRNGRVMSGRLFQERTGAAATTPAAVAGDPVGTWRLETGQYMTAPSDAARPTLQFASGKPVLRFDGTNDQLAESTAVAAAAPLVFAAACTPSSLAANGTVLSAADTAGDGNWFRFLFATTPSVNMDSQGTAFVGLAASGVAPVAGTRYRVSAEWASATARRIYVDGVLRGSELVTSSVPAGIDVLTVGALNRATDVEFFNGDLAGFVVLNAIPSAAERALLDAYLVSL